MARPSATECQSAEQMDGCGRGGTDGGLVHSAGDGSTGFVARGGLCM